MEPDQQSDWDRLTAILKLVETEYSMINHFIAGIAGTGFTIRGWVLTVWLGLLGLGFQQARPIFAWLALGLIVAFGLLDSYQSILYSFARSRATYLEGIFAKYQAVLARYPADPDVREDLEVVLVAYKFGVFRNLRQVAVRDFPAAWRRERSLWPYAPITVAGLAAAIVLSALPAKPPSAAPCEPGVPPGAGTAPPPSGTAAPKTDVPTAPRAPAASEGSTAPDSSRREATVETNAPPASTGAGGATTPSETTLPNANVPGAAPPSPAGQIPDRAPSRQGSQ